MHSVGTIVLEHCAGKLILQVSSDLERKLVTVTLQLLEDPSVEISNLAVSW